MQVRKVGSGLLHMSGVQDRSAASTEVYSCAQRNCELLSHALNRPQRPKPNSSKVFALESIHVQQLVDRHHSYSVACIQLGTKPSEVVHRDEVTQMCGYTRS